MKFRKAVESDIDNIMCIIKQAQDYFKSQKIDQWQNNYPNYEIIKNDIKNNNGYVLLKDNIIVIEDLKEFTQELRGIGKNLNQLTILSHQGKINTLDLSSTKQKVNEIWQLLNLLMQKMKR
jgi:hypothetical protein